MGHRNSDNFPTFATQYPQSLCREIDPEIFYPEKGGTTREAKKICDACVHESECLEDALTRKERFGFFGGVPERERRAMIRRREKGLASQPDSEVAKPQKKTAPPRRLGQVIQMHEQGLSVSFIAASLNIKTESVHQNLRRHRAKASA